MDRQQYGHVIGNPSDYGGMEYPQQMMVPDPGLHGGVIQGGQPMIGGLGVGLGGAIPMIGNPPAQAVARGRSEGGGGGGDLLEELLGPFPVVRLRGLPFEAQVSDIIVFFQGIGVLDVVLLQRGEAIVLFNTVMDCQMALGRDRQNMGRRYIEVFQAKRFDYYNAISQTWAGDGQGDRPGPPMGLARWVNRPHHPGVSVPGVGPNGARDPAAMERAANSGVLKLRGLPFSSTKADIQQFFEGYSLRPDGIQFVYRQDGRLTGEAFVSFTNPEDARAAHRAKDRSMIGSRYVEIFPSTPEECARLTANNRGGA